jgi:hypothetical protein
MEMQPSFPRAFGDRGVWFLENLLCLKRVYEGTRVENAFWNVPRGKNVTSSTDRESSAMYCCRVTWCKIANSLIDEFWTVNRQSGHFVHGLRPNFRIADHPDMTQR